MSAQAETVAALAPRRKSWRQRLPRGWPLLTVYLVIIGVFVVAGVSFRIGGTHFGDGAGIFRNGLFGSFLPSAHFGDSAGVFSRYLRGLLQQSTDFGKGNRFRIVGRGRWRSHSGDGLRKVWYFHAIRFGGPGIAAGQILPSAFRHKDVSNLVGCLDPL